MNNITVLFGLTGIFAVAYALYKVVSQVKAGDWDMVVKWLVFVAGGIGAALLYWSTQLADLTSFEVADTQVIFSSLDWQTVVWVGLSIGLAAGGATDVLRAIDNTRTSATQPLVGASPPEG